MTVKELLHILEHADETDTVDVTFPGFHTLHGREVEVRGISAARSAGSKVVLEG